MRKAKKLTPELLKKIIAEEKNKLKKLKILKEKKSQPIRRPNSVKNDISNLRILREQQKKIVNAFKLIYRKRQKIKKNLIKRL